MIYFIRHAESKYNKAAAEISARLGKDYLKTEQYIKLKFSPEYYDVEITQNGQQQCVNARKNIQELDFDIILVSPLRRALRTCQIMFENHKSKAHVIVEPAFRQIMESSNDIGTHLQQSQKEFQAFNFNKISDKEAWYIHTLQQQKDRQHILSKIKGLHGEQRKAKGIQHMLQIMKDNWNQRSKAPELEEKLKERILPSYSEQVKVIQQYSQQYSKIAIVAHSQCIKRYAGYKLKNCQVFPVQLYKI